MSELSIAVDDELSRLREELAACKLELEKTQMELQASRNRKGLLRSLLDSLPALIYYLDLEGRYLGCNRAFAEVVGLEGEILGWTLDEISLTPEYQQNWDQDRTEIIAGKSMREEIHFQQYQLEVIRAPYYVDGQVIGLIGIAHDISGLKQASLALRTSEARTRQILDTVSVGIFVVTPDGQPYYSNPRAREIIGPDVDLDHPEYRVGDAYQTYNSDTGELFDPEDLPINRALRGESVHARHFESRRGNRVIDMEITAAPIYDENGKLTSALAVFNDISEYKAKEAELIEARERAEAANRAKGDFLANMSHEIRTPLHAIIGFNQLLQRTSLDKRQQDYVRNNQQAAKNLLNIINDILDMSKIEAGMLRIENTAFDLRQVLEQLFRLLSRQAQEKSLELVIQLAPELPTALMGDPLRLEQVLINLVGNAIKFTEAGEITLIINIVNRDPAQCTLGFEIRDTGIGIAPEQQAHLFQAFAQADTSTTRKYGGSGLGLTISRHLVNLMGGDLGFTSVPGQGSRFFFTARFGLQSEALVKASGGLEQLRALIVDDHQVVLDVMTEYLLRMGIQTQTWLAGRHSLEQLHSLSQDTYDLILMDWNLPNYSGIDILSPFFDSKPSPKLVLMTGSAPEKLAQTPLSRPYDAVLYKPIQPSHLYDLLGHLFPEMIKADAEFYEPNPALLELIQGARLLVVEDNPVNQRLARELLQAHGFIVDVASDGLECLNQLKQQTYDLILMDLQMPVMDGITAARKIRSRSEYASLPVVAMTADAVAGIREKVLEVGMNDYITKPIELNRLFEALVRWIPARSQSPQTAVPLKTPASDQIMNQLEKIQGIELKTALRRAGGNAALYLELLEDFGFRLPEQLDALNLSLQNPHQPDPHADPQITPEPYTLALQQAHAIKGAAANLGIPELASALAALETQLRQQQAADMSAVDRAARSFLIQLAEHKTG